MEKTSSIHSRLKQGFFLVAWIFLCEFAGIVGALFTVQAIPLWYDGLIKPFGNPPSWVFGPIWTLLYLLMGISAFLIWQKGIHKKALYIFFVQLGLNAIWSVLFFGLHNPAIALLDILLLWLAIYWTIRVFSKIDRIAGILLLPYILWVSYATYLNFSIWFLN